MNHYYTSNGILVNKDNGFPSVTTILDIRDKPELDQWRLTVGAEYADAIVTDATTKGTAIHEAVESFIKTRKYTLPKQYQPLMDGFVRWYEKVLPTDCKTELFLFSELHEYAGRTDLVCTIDGERWLVDVKTSKRLDPAMGLQLVAYKTAYQEMSGETVRTAILQLTDKIKRGYRWKEYDEDFGVFYAHKTIHDWIKENKR